MTRILLTLVVVLIVASVAAASHRSLFGWREGVRTRLVTRDRHVERERTGPVLPRLRTYGGGCIGTVTAVRAQAAPAGCSGWTGPAMPAIQVKPVPMPMPPVKVAPKPEPELETFTYWGFDGRGRFVKEQRVRPALVWKK